MGDDFSLEDALIILKRRIWYFLIPAAGLTLFGLAIVMLLPSRYTAEGTILVESAQISDDLVKSTINTYAQERIQVIKQRVMTREKLLEVAEKYQVFPRARRLTQSERVKKMRDRLKVAVITADSQRVGGQRDNTIAFTVSYTDPSPERAYEVANEFMSLFLSEDVRARTTGASNTTEFFKGEAQRLAAAVETIEQRISEYKAANSGSLPEYLPLNMEMLDSANDDLSQAQSNLTSVEDNIRLVETQLATLLGGATTGEAGPSQEIVKLETELARLRAVYRDNHPAVRSIIDQIASLKGQLAPSKEMQSLIAALEKSEADLRDAKATLQPGDPILSEKRAAVKAAQDKLNQRMSAEASSATGNMFSAQLQGQLSVSRSRRDALLQQIEDSKVEIEEFRKRIEKTPETERGLAGLMREQKNVNAEYQELQDKKAKAQLAENLEENQKAEKFSILEAAERPEKPSSPERVKLSVLSLFFALGAGAAAAAGAEFLTATIRGRAHLNKVIGADPIAVIPNFERERDKAEGPRFGFGRKPRTSPPAEQASTSPGDSQSAKTDELVS